MSRASRVLSLVRNRRPVRRFEERPIPSEIVDYVLDSARYAPSAKEAQPWRFVVVRDALTRHEIATAAFNHPHVKSAPLVILCCARVHSHVSGSGRPSHPVDVAAATQTMLLAAADQGLAASWIPGYREPGVRAAVGIPNDVPIVAILALGYPDGFGSLPERLPRDRVISWDRWPGAPEGRGSR
ncbi:MAG: nitroreductase family protein [Gemmatimonadota bacterium]